jgi:hypothetical protein
MAAQHAIAQPFMLVRQRGETLTHFMLILALGDIPGHLAVALS